MPLPCLYSGHCVAGPVAPGTRCFIFVSFLVIIVVVVVVVVVVVAPVAVVDGQ